MFLPLSLALLSAGLSLVTTHNVIPEPVFYQPEPPVAVCVVTPRVEPVEEGDAIGIVPVSRPQLIVIEPLVELRILRPDAAAWTLTGTRDEPIPSPLAWPTKPIAPEELILLQLRPREAPADAFAHVYLVGASADRMSSTQTLIQELDQRETSWISTIEAALTAGDIPMAWALLFSPQTPPHEVLLDLQEEVIRRGCGS